MRRAAIAVLIVACGPPTATTATTSATASTEATSTASAIPATSATASAARPPTTTGPTVPTPGDAPPAPAPSSLRAPRAAAPPTIDGVLDDTVWSATSPIAITTDYAGGTIASPATVVRILWVPQALYLSFDCTFDPPLTAPDAPLTPEYAHLYGYDVVEIFVDADPSTASTYREIELGPRGHTLDVAVDLSARPHGDVAWSSRTEHAEHVDEVAHRFAIEARIPASALERDHLEPGDLRIGLFRITSHAPSPRLFLARFPTLTPRPNFHVPERFGRLTLSP